MMGRNKAMTGRDHGGRQSIVVAGHPSFDLHLWNFSRFRLREIHSQGLSRLEFDFPRARHRLAILVP
jgi:hypothetical protein